MIDRRAILDHLQPGPVSREDLGKELGYPDDLLRHELLCLTHAGLVKRVGADHRYALASYVARMGRPLDTFARPASPSPMCAHCRRKPSRGYAGGRCRACARLSGAPVEANVADEGRQIVRRRPPSADVTPALRAAARPPCQTTVLVVDGVEYETVDYEALLRKKAADWPKGGSSLTPAYFERPRLHSPRGARS